MHEAMPVHMESDFDDLPNRATLINEKGQIFPISSENTVIYFCEEIEDTFCITSKLLDPSNPQSPVTEQHLFIKDKKLVDKLLRLEFPLAHKKRLSTTQVDTYTDPAFESSELLWDILEQNDTKVADQGVPDSTKADHADIFYESPVIEIAVGDEKIHATHRNLKVYKFEEVPYMTCLEFTEPNGTRTYMFGPPDEMLEIADNFIEQDFPRHYEVMPVSADGQRIYEAHMSWLRSGTTLEALSSSFLKDPPEETV